jgi:hypothetical protein
MDPTRRIGFDYPHKVRQSQCRRDLHQDMDVVSCPVDDQRSRAGFPNDSTDVGEELPSQFGVMSGRRSFVEKVQW